MGFIEDNKKSLAIVIIIIIIIILVVWKPWVAKADFSPKQYWHTRRNRRREGIDSEGEAEVAEIAPVGTSQLDGDIPGHLASVNDPSFMTTPSIVLSTTSRGGENLSYKNITTDIRGSIPRVYGGSGSTFNQNIQLEDTNINPDTY